MSRGLLRLAALLALCAPVPATTAQEIGAGQLAYNNHCRECHSSDKDDNRLGPTLYGIVGRKAGTQPGYGGYSDALKQSGLVWDEATLDRWIESPDAVLPGNVMQPPYPGVDDPIERKLIIDFLKSDTMTGGARASPSK